MPDFTGLSVATLAYLAGLIDGEGTITVTYHTPRKGKHKYLTLWVKVANTDARMTEWIKSALSGWITVYHRPPYKICYVWGDTGQRAASILRAVYPYLITKKEQAKLAIEMCGSMDGITHITPQMQTYRENIAEQIRSLNRRKTKVA